MVEGRAKLVVDLGNTETRVKTLFGKTSSGKPRSRLTLLSNKFGELSDTKLLSNPDYNEENSKVFRVDNTSLFCTGDMCDKEKGTAAQRPSSSIKKYSSAISMYSMRLAFLTGFHDVADISKQSVDSLNITWDVTVLLPPSDIDLGKEELIRNIRKIQDIDFLLPKFSKKIVIDKINVYPEGFCAYIGEVFETIRKVRPGFTDVVSGATLVADIGGGTTDLCVVLKNKLIDNSRYSEETGGNQVFQKTNIELRKKYGRNFPEDSLRAAAITGKIKVGAREEDIFSIVEFAKKDVATKLSTAIRNYIESINFSIYDIENILICGGGNEECVSGGKSLGEYLAESLKDWMSFSNFLEMPQHKVTVEKDGIEYSKVEKISPRLLNIIGASILAEVG